MQNRRALFAGLAGTVIAAKARPEADDATAPGTCPRCGRVHGQPDAPLKGTSK